MVDYEPLRHLHKVATEYMLSGNWSCSVIALLVNSRSKKVERSSRHPMVTLEPTRRLLGFHKADMSIFSAGSDTAPCRRILPISASSRPLLGSWTGQTRILRLSGVSIDMSHEVHAALSGGVDVKSLPRGELLVSKHSLQRSVQLGRTQSVRAQ